MIKLQPRLWVGVGLSVLAGGAALADTATQWHQDGAIALQVAQGGEGGEGGEGGISAADAAKDPVAFISALDVTAAHYHAGLAAYKADKHQAAGEMFAHPISEIYVDLEPVFTARGAKPFQNEMSKASELALGNAPVAEVEKAAKAVLTALDTTAAKAPKSSDSAKAVQAKLLAGMIERAARQYRSASASTEFEPYLDGYGFAITAKVRSEALVKAGVSLAAEVVAAIDLLLKAYPTALRPATLPVALDALSGQTAKAQLALARVR